jgi:hypothetical protein
MGPTSYSQADVTGLDETFGMGQMDSTNTTGVQANMNALDAGSDVYFPLGGSEPSVNALTDLSEAQ